MNERTKQSREWRALQKRLGRLPKLIWIDPLDWPRVQRLIDLLKLARERKLARKVLAAAIEEEKNQCPQREKEKKQ